jgi:prepilin-type N-terminal cleavage/methylation domain-containing protein
MLRSVPKACEGYTFIELLIAISILGIVITPMFTLFSVSSLSIYNSGNHTLAANLCRNQLENLKATGYNSVLELCDTYGNAFIVEKNLPGYPVFSRTTRIQAYEEGPLQAGDNNTPEPPLLLQIEITVNWTVRGSLHSETVTTVLGPW